MIQNSTVLWPLVAYFVTILLLTGALLGGSYLLGGSHKERTTGEPYESGIRPTGSAHLRFDIKFYLLATFFVIFDLETIFLFAWAVAGRQLGWAGYIETVIFIVILLAALAYLWRTGTLEWGTRPRLLSEERKDKQHGTPP